MTDNSEPLQKIKTQMAVLEHRVKELESTPPRVNDLEHSVGQLEVQFKSMNEDIGEIKVESKETHGLVLKLGEDIRRLFYTGVVIAGLASAVLMGLKIYDSWQSIHSSQGGENESQTSRSLRNQGLEKQ